ncbi:MarR family transcriptional regulator [Bacillus sp. AFS073361]|uniref:MarR family transcriptional regulator n=1 Tax=Bacillus sp. AFS073361 TaxID=2033511 RepID=UPI000BF8D2FF|nr:MarR family transcriptional regulator [Bacillus sp. AFS073361]PFP30209.1 MarR family transcriptional regulator [Bacillus sp. AFS073361]
MNESKKLNINHAVARYLVTKGEADFNEVYRSLHAEYRKKIAYWSTSTFMANKHDVMEIFDDMLLRSLDAVEKNGGDFVKLFHLSLNSRYKSLLRKLTTRRKFEQYEVESEEDEKPASFEIDSGFRIEEEIIAKKKADQRQLIDSLLNDADAKTTAIVEAFLVSENASPTAIGEALGLHHSTVIRSLKRLAGKFDSKKYGDYTDFLVAL